MPEKAVAINKGEITKVEAQASKQLAVVSEIQIRSSKDLEEAKTVLSEIATLEKMVKEKKDGILKPLNEAVKQVRSLFAPMEAKIEEAKTSIKKKMLAYNDKVVAEAAKKEEEMTKKVQSGEISMAKAGEKIEKAQAKAEAIPTREVRKVEFGDPAGLSAQQLYTLAQNGYLAWNEVKARKDVLNGIELPGTRVVVEKTIVGRSF